MLFTRLAHDAGFLCCSRSKTSSPSNTADKEEKGDEGENDLIVEYSCDKESMLQDFLYRIKSSNFMHNDVLHEWLIDLIFMSIADRHMLNRWLANIVWNQLIASSIHAESKTDISVIHLQAEEQTKMLLKVVNFLEDLNAKELVNQKCQDLANKLDKICFWVYVCVCIIYFSIMTYMIINYPCEVNHFDFWY